jgi:hypothetical protein
MTASDAEAQTSGMERRGERRGGRHERRQVRRTGRTERREERRACKWPEALRFEPYNVLLPPGGGAGAAPGAPSRP